MNFSFMSNKELWRQFRKSATAKPPPQKPVSGNLFGFSWWVRRNRVGERWRLIARLFEIMTGHFATYFYSFVTGYAIGFVIFYGVFLPTGSWTLFILAACALAIVLLPRSSALFYRAVFALRRHIFIRGDGRFIKRQCVAADDFPPELRSAYLLFKRALPHDAQFVVLDCILFGFGRHGVLSIEGFRRGYPVLDEYMVLESEREEEEEEKDFEYPQDS